MSKKNMNKQMLVVGLTVFLITVFLCGCNSDSNSNNGVDSKSFIGTWTGNLVSLFKERTTNISELTFIGTTVDVTIKSDRGTQIMTYTYMVEEDKLVLNAYFDDERPSDGERSPEGRQLPDREHHTSMPNSFVYSFNEEYDVLYLNGSEFIKAN